jgi:hypothetical protein
VIRIPAILALLFATASGAQSLPGQLTDAELWKLIGTISEPGGSFHMDNFTSNEPEVGRLSTLLRETGRVGGVYMGVGPEQNFSYIAAIKPRMAFIVDIRRQAVVQHLMYKAMFELSKDRADFIAMLFGLPRPTGIDSTMRIDQIWPLFHAVMPSVAKHDADYQKILTHLTKTHGFALTREETALLKYVFDAFYANGPFVSAGRGRGGAGGSGQRGNFVTLTVATDNAGHISTFLGTEAAYRTVKSLQARNLIVPVSGNFGGPQAIRRVGEYVREHRATITAFYVSNVERYLFEDRLWRAFYDNVATLPLTARSVFIRPYGYREHHTTTSGLCPIQGYLKAVSAGRVTRNADALRCTQ